MSDGMERLRTRYPWPSELPRVPASEHNWFRAENREVLSWFAPPCQVVMELGSWCGASARHLCACSPGATVVCVDHWRGAADYLLIPEAAELLPSLYETFLASCWEQRGQIIPVRRDTLTGMAEVASYGVRPGLIYVDADHTEEAVFLDVSTASRLFPFARIVGDDWDWEAVRAGVSAQAAALGRKVYTKGPCWWLE